jgi:osmoprotectant transport system ATP-binding protein
VTAPPALSAQSVVKRYGTFTALDGVSLEVSGGECVAFVGESGSGKTTLLRCFNRLIEPDSGQIAVGGEALRGVDPIALRRRTGYVLQEGGLLPHWTVLRNVELVPWLTAADDPRALALEALALVGLDAATFGGRWPHELSGGQRQRVAMARALASRPSVVLLDEPFGALDAITRADLQAMFRDVRSARPTTTILVTHDLIEARRLADRIAVLRAGRVEQMSPARELFAHPATDYVRRLVERAGVHDLEAAS